jgi:hypothetical protein
MHIAILRVHLDRVELLYITSTVLSILNCNLRRGYFYYFYY